MHAPRSLLTALFVGIVAPLVAANDYSTGPTVWSFDETTSGNDILWTSPTSEDPTGSVYSTSTTIDLLEVGISFLGIPFGSVDVTDQIPPELAAGGGEFAGPAPLEFAAESLVFPEPPEPTSIAADLAIGMDAGGFGFFSASNVVLGTVEVDLGGIFGVVNADITSIRVAGTVSVQATWFDLASSLAGAAGAPVLLPSGSLEGGASGSLTVSNAAPGASAFVVLSLVRIDAPFKGGVLVPNPDLLIGLPVDALGGVALPFVWPVGVPSRAAFYTQVWVQDAGGPAGFAATNAVQGLTP